MPLELERPKLSAEEERLPYAKYFHKPLAPIPQEKLDIWNGPAADPGRRPALCSARAFSGRRCARPGQRLLRGARRDRFCGQHHLHARGHRRDVQLVVRLAQRYLRPALQAVGPGGPLHARADRPDYVKDPAVPTAQKTWGVKHDIVEDIGFGPDPLLLCFCKPSELGYRLEKIGTPACQAMVCAYGVGSTPAVMTHVAKQAEGGSCSAPDSGWATVPTNRGRSSSSARRRQRPRGGPPRPLWA